MSKLIAINEEYATWVKDIKSRFRRSQLQASLKVNQEVLRFYWQLGRDMVQMNIEQRWGEGVMKMLSQDLKEALPEVNGFSPSNLYYIKRFYVTYNQQVEILPQLGAKLPEHEETAFLPQTGAKIEGDAIGESRDRYLTHSYHITGIVFFRRPNLSSKLVTNSPTQSKLDSPFSRFIIT